MTQVRRVIVIVDDMRPDTQAAFIQWLTDMRCAWSHWFKGAWFIALLPGTSVSVNAIDQKLKELGDNRLMKFVFELSDEPAAWSGSIDAALATGARTWLRQQWGFTVAEPVRKG